MEELDRRIEKQNNIFKIGRQVMTTTDDKQPIYYYKRYWYCDTRYKKYCIKVVSPQDVNKGIINFKQEHLLDEWIAANKTAN
jgi:hypothetical protein